MMVNFAILVVPLAAGILAGYALRKRWHANLTKVSSAIIIILIFSLGFSIGSNNDALSSLPRVGWNALFIAVLSIAFSIAMVELVRRKVKLG
jgi:uncharacterized membrane protein YbjE (DUF340 family)